MNGVKSSLRHDSRPVGYLIASKVLLKAVVLKSSFVNHAPLPQKVSTMPRSPSIDLRSILAKNVRAFRSKHCYSQEALADSCGLHRPYVGAIERGE